MKLYVPKRIGASSKSGMEFLETLISCLTCGIIAKWLSHSAAINPFIAHSREIKQTSVEFDLNDAKRLNAESTGCIL